MVMTSLVTSFYALGYVHPMYEVQRNACVDYGVFCTEKVTNE